jgi:hypothetical protein
MPIRAGERPVEDNLAVHFPKRVHRNVTTLSAHLSGLSTKIVDYFTSPNKLVNVRHQYFPMKFR